MLPPAPDGVYRGLDINVVGFGALTAAQQPNNFYGYAGTGGAAAAGPLPVRRQGEDAGHDVRAAAVHQGRGGVQAGRHGRRRSPRTRNGISAHIDFVNARNLDNDQSPTQITAAEKAAFLADTGDRARRRRPG